MKTVCSVAVVLKSAVVRATMKMIVRMTRNVAVRTTRKVAVRTGMKVANARERSHPAMAVGIL
jgi:hypothetical protein